MTPQLPIIPSTSSIPTLSAAPFCFVFPSPDLIDTYFFLEFRGYTCSQLIPRPDLACTALFSYSGM